MAGRFLNDQKQPSSYWNFFDNNKIFLEHPVYIINSLQPTERLTLFVMIKKPPLLSLFKIEEKP